MTTTAVITVGASLVIALITAPITAFITYYLTRKREREADWRKLKLERYQEFFLAVSGVVGSRADAEAKERLSDAGNSLSLIAPLDVIHALHAYQYEVSPANREKMTLETHDKAVSALFRALRKDIHPSDPKDDPSFRFKLSGPTKADISHQNPRS